MKKNRRGFSTNSNNYLFVGIALQRHGVFQIPIRIPCMVRQNNHSVVCKIFPKSAEEIIIFLWSVSRKRKDTTIVTGGNKLTSRGGG
jgi:hypothetical protein